MERMELNKETIKKIFTTYCFYTELKGIIDDAPPFIKESYETELNYYEELFKDVLADIYGQKENDKKARKLGNHLQLKLINTPKEMSLEDYNFLLGLFKSLLIMTKPNKDRKERLTKNIDVIENGRGFFIFKHFSETEREHYISKKTDELEKLEDHLTNLLSDHMTKKYGAGGLMINTRSGRIKEF